ncbi:MAG: hypothetical protein ABI717_09110 [Actinomycetota bacterium]
MRLLHRHAPHIAVAALALAYAWPMQGVGFNQSSHYILVKSLARGTAVVDRTLHETGDLTTEDVIRLNGHIYSNKAPGLAAVTLPPFLVLEAAGARTVGDPTRMLWALGLFGAVLPATALLLLVRRVAARIEPGFGTVTAVTLGAATLLMPFATLFFAHALSAFLVFASFAILFAERHGRQRLALVAVAGLLAGLAGVTEYPNAFAALVFGVYALSRSGWALRGLAYLVGVLVGLAPLALYNRWAFGSFTHLSYVGDAVPGGGLKAPRVGRFDLETLLETLFGRVGLLTLAPVLVCGVVGLVLLYRRGWRAEALVIAATAALYVLYNASYGSNFGGFSAGQRYLIPIVPLLAVPLALAFRSFPITTGALALVSAVVAVTITPTYALAAYDGRWFDNLGDLQFTPTPASLVGVTGWYTILPFFLAVAVAGVCAFIATPKPHLTALDTLAAPVAVLAWALVAATAPATPFLGGQADRLSAYWGLALAAAALSTSAVAASAFRYRRARARS